MGENPTAPGQPPAHTAQAILDAGEFLFPRQGFHGTSVRQLARYAGITPAAIYNHFPSKEAVFTALLSARSPLRILALALSQSKGETAEALLQDGIRRMEADLGERADNLRLVLVELLEFEGRHLPQVMPELMAPALSFMERLRSADPRLGRWPAPYLLRLISGTFAAFAVTQSYLRQIEGMAGGRQDYDDLAAILAAGLRHAVQPSPNPEGPG